MNFFSYKNGVLSRRGCGAGPCWRTKSARLSIAIPAPPWSGTTKSSPTRLPKDSLIAFSVKANGNLAVLKTLAKLGAGADVVSGGELKKALRAGIPANRIVFSGVGKTQDEMRLALAAGIYQFNVESEPELEALNEVALAMGKRAPVTLRINPDVDAKTHAKITTGTAETKFGIPFAPCARGLCPWPPGLKGIEIVGIDVHIGSQITDLEPFEAAFRRVARTGRRPCAPMAMPSRAWIWAAGWACPISRTTTAAARSGGLWRDGDAGDQGPGLPPDLRARPADRRQCRRAGVARDLCEAGRGQDLPDRRCRHERPDPAGAVRFPSRNRAASGNRRPAATALHYDVVGPVCETSDLFAAGPVPAGTEIGRSCGDPVGGRLWRGDVLGLQCAAARAGSLGQGRGMEHCTARQTHEQLIAEDHIPDWLAG